MQKRDIKYILPVAAVVMVAASSLKLRKRFKASVSGNSRVASFENDTLDKVDEASRE